MVLITQSNNSLPGRLSHALWGGGSGDGREKCCTIFIFQLHNRITCCSRRESTEDTFFEQISQEVKAVAAAGAGPCVSIEQGWQEKHNTRAQGELLSA